MTKRTGNFDTKYENLKRRNSHFYTVLNQYVCKKMSSFTHYFLQIKQKLAWRKVQNNIEW